MATLKRNLLSGLVCLMVASCGTPGGQRIREAGAEYPVHRLAGAELRRPGNFPDRIWAACDFELERTDVVWLGSPERQNIPDYPGNSTALAGRLVPVGHSRFLAVKPAYSPVMDEHGYLYFRFFLQNVSALRIELATLEDSLPSGLRMAGLPPGHWSELTVGLTDFTSRDGALFSPEGRRMSDLLFSVEPETKDKSCALIVDDIILFSRAPDALPSEAPFPRRVICLENFDIEDQHSRWMDSYLVGRLESPNKGFRGFGRGVESPGGPGRMVRISIDPPQPVGAETRLNFRYLLEGADWFQVQVFDLTDMDNRHIQVRNVHQGLWQRMDLDFTASSRRNDGTQSPFSPGHRVDDFFFFAGRAGETVRLLVDEVVLYDAGR